MKNLFFKEMKLSMHPIIWIFICCFPFMVIIPNYPKSIAFIYAASMYPILFLGANKGQQSNDIFYSCLLPIRREEVVKARMISTTIIQVIPILIMLILLPLSIQIDKNILFEMNKNLGEGEQPIESTLSIVGFGSEQFGFIIAFALIAFSIYDLIFYPMFYKNGRTIVGGTLAGIFAFSMFLLATTVILPLKIESVKNFFLNSSPLIQVLFVVVALIIYIILHMIVYTISVKRFKKVDF